MLVRGGQGTAMSRGKKRCSSPGGGNEGRVHHWQMEGGKKKNVGADSRMTGAKEGGSVIRIWEKWEKDAVREIGSSVFKQIKESK